MTIISTKFWLSKLVSRTWGSAPPPLFLLKNLRFSSKFNNNSNLRLPAVILITQYTINQRFPVSKNIWIKSITWELWTTSACFFLWWIKLLLSGPNQSNQSFRITHQAINKLINIIHGSISYHHLHNFKFKKKRESVEDPTLQGPSSADQSIDYLTHQAIN